MCKNSVTNLLFSIFVKSDDLKMSFCKEEELISTTDSEQEQVTDYQKEAFTTDNKDSSLSDEIIAHIKNSKQQTADETQEKPENAVLNTNEELTIETPTDMTYE